MRGLDAHCGGPVYFIAHCRAAGPGERPVGLLSELFFCADLPSGISSQFCSVQSWYDIMRHPFERATSSTNEAGLPVVLSWVSHSHEPKARAVFHCEDRAYLQGLSAKRLEFCRLPAGAFNAQR